MAYALHESFSPQEKEFGFIGVVFGVFNMLLFFPLAIFAGLLFIAEGLNRLFIYKK